MSHASLHFHVLCVTLNCTQCQTFIHGFHLILLPSYIHSLHVHLIVNRFLHSVSTFAFTTVVPLHPRDLLIYSLFCTPVLLHLRPPPPMETQTHIRSLFTQSPSFTLASNWVWLRVFSVVFSFSQEVTIITQLYMHHSLRSPCLIFVNGVICYGRMGGLPVPSVCVREADW